MEIDRPIVYRGAREIAAAVGINWKRMKHYVDNKQLPAFQVEDGGLWLALPEDLLEWVRKQRNEQLNK